MRCSIVYSDEVATPLVITANTVWKEFETTLKARLKHVININIDLLISYKVHRSLSKGTHLTAFALIVYGR